LSVAAKAQAGFTHIGIFMCVYIYFHCGMPFQHPVIEKKERKILWEE